MKKSLIFVLFFATTFYIQPSEGFLTLSKSVSNVDLLHAEGISFGDGEKHKDHLSDSPTPPINPVSLDFSCFEKLKDYSELTLEGMVELILNGQPDLYRSRCMEKEDLKKYLLDLLKFHQEHGLLDKDESTK